MAWPNITTDTPQNQAPFLKQQQYFHLNLGPEVNRDRHQTLSSVKYKDRGKKRKTNKQKERQRKQVKFLKQMVPNNLISLWEKMNLSLISHQAKTLTQNGSQTNLNVQTKTTKLLEENRRKVWDFAIGKDFLGYKKHK